MVETLVDAAKDLEDAHGELYNQYEVMARFFALKFPIKKDMLQQEHRAEGIRSGQEWQPLPDTAYRAVAFGSDARRNIPAEAANLRTI